MSEPQVLFTIITTSLNSGTKLIDTHKSVASQGVDYEYIIMDGGSSDGSREIGEKLAAQDSRIRFFSERDKGIYDAMNKSIARATGQFIYFIGAGDLLLAGALGEIAKYLPRRLNAFVYGDCILDGKRYAGKFSKVGLTELNVCHQSIFYGREVFEICGNYNCKYRALADWEFNMRCFGNRHIEKIYVPLVVAVFEPGGFSGPGDPAFRADQDALIRTHLGFFTHLAVSVLHRYHRFRIWSGRVRRDLWKSR